MATVSYQNAIFAPIVGLGQWFATAWQSITTTYEIAVFKYSRMEEIEKLNNLTDYELADQYGINRDQIPFYVFSDKFYL